MTELKLKFTDEKGEEKLLAVEAEKFSVGRHSENDLSIANSAVSRRHVKIERFADVFIISDSGASLGTKINGKDLDDPVALYDGDKINLGGGFEMEVVIISDEENAGNAAADSGGAAAAGDNVENNSPAAVSAASISSNSGGASSIPTSVFYLAPVFGVLVLLGIGGILLAIGGGNKSEKPPSNDFVYSNDIEKNDDGTPEIKPSIETETLPDLPSNEDLPENSEVNAVQPSPQETATQPPPKLSGELEKIEVNSAGFLRRIAQSDPRAFLTEEQQKAVLAKVAQVKNSPNLAENLKSAKKNAAQIQTLASSKNLKPQFLTIAALTGLGGNRGDALQSAQTIAQVLDDLSRNIGDERSDDALLVIAAYDQGASGNSLALRNKLQSLVDESPNSSRQIRTIWYLRRNNHITEAEFEAALRFLAIGTIAQNPKQFGVNAEAINF